MGAWTLRRMGITLTLVASSAAPLNAQAAEPSAQAPARPSARVPSVVRYGKWVALGGAFALGLRANALHRDANDSYQTLRDRCFELPLNCELTGNGSYADPTSERLYTDTRDLDHQAARYLVGAEVSFTLAAVGFIWELVKREDTTPNIPFGPRVEATPRETRVGMTLRF